MVSAPRALLDTGGKRNGVRPLANQRVRPQHYFLSGTASAVDKTHQLNILHTCKSAFPLTDGLKIPTSGAIVLCLRTTNNSQFHI